MKRGDIFYDLIGVFSIFYFGLNDVISIFYRWEVTEEGRGMVERGSHEAVVWNLIGEGGMPQPELFTAAGFCCYQKFFNVA